MCLANSAVPIILCTKIKYSICCYLPAALQIKRRQSFNIFFTLWCGRIECSTINFVPFHINVNRWRWTNFKSRYFIYLVTAPRYLNGDSLIYAVLPKHIIFVIVLCPCRPIRKRPIILWRRLLISTLGPTRKV